MTSTDILALPITRYRLDCVAQTPIRLPDHAGSLSCGAFGRALRQVEFAIIIRTNMKGQGQGSSLMRKMIAYSRERGVRIFSGDVMYDNQPMLDLLKHLGFSFGRSEEPGIVRCTLDFQASTG